MENYYSMIGSTSNEMDEVLSDINDCYLSYPIKKRSGKYRWIDAPQEPLIDLQRAILYNILYTFKTHDCCIGFTRHKSVTDGANACLLYTSDAADE